MIERSHEVVKISLTIVGLDQLFVFDSRPD